jgi:hypothetical protein
MLNHCSSSYQLMMLYISAAKLADITVEKVAEAFQVTPSNPMVGLEGRTSLLINLSKALKASPQFFGEDGRPGNIVGTSSLHVASSQRNIIFLCCNRFS